jgi:uncharacterized protein HemX
VPATPVSNAEATLITPPAQAAPVASVDKTLVRSEATIAPPLTTPVQTLPPQAKSHTPMVALIVGLSVIVLGAGVWFTYQRQASDGATAGQGATPQSAVSTAPASPQKAAPVAPTAALKSDPGTMLISAVGLIDPSDPR